MIYDDYSVAVANDNAIIPGDILIVRGVHVAIVRSVEFTGGIRTLNDNQLIVIEAAQGNFNERRVIKTRTRIMLEILYDYNLRRLLQ